MTRPLTFENVFSACPLGPRRGPVRLGVVAKVWGVCVAVVFVGGRAHLCFHCLSLACWLPTPYLPCVNESTCVCMWMNACVCACVYLFVCVYAPVCSGMLGQALHYGAHDFFPEKHVSPFLKSASSSDRQLAVSPAVCMSWRMYMRLY